MADESTQLVLRFSLRDHDIDPVWRDGLPSPAEIRAYPLPLRVRRRGRCARPEWIATQWDIARAEAAAETVLVPDEVQKVRAWSESVKRLWDEDTRRGTPLRVAACSSS